jgi:hypothetical protein
METAKLSRVLPKAYLLTVAEQAIRAPGAVLTPGSLKSSLPIEPA